MMMVPHDRFPGVYVVGNNNNNNTLLYTKNLVPGRLTPPLYHDDVVISGKDHEGTIVEYREWNPSKSSLAAAILCGAQNIWIKPGSRVLVLYPPGDELFGTTISHISDLVGPRGMVYVVDASSNWKTLADMADKRFNIVPIIQTALPSRYRMMINTVRYVYVNALYFLEARGHYVLYAKADCMESTSFTSVGKRAQNQFNTTEQVNLEPFDGDHAFVMGAFRMVEMAKPICQEIDKFWTAPSSHRRDGVRVSLYEKLKDLPTYLLFDSSCGYALFLAHDVYGVERNFKAIEEYINRFDEVYELIAYHPFESVDEAMMYLNAAYNETLPEQLFEQLTKFLVRNLPTPMDGDKNCYSLAVPEGILAAPIAVKTTIACSRNLFHDEIIRGVRMHIDKFIKDIMPGDLEKAQLDLAQNYCMQRLMSPDKGKSQKKRGRVQACTPSRKNPMRKVGQKLTPSKGLCHQTKESHNRREVEFRPAPRAEKAQ